MGTQTLTKIQNLIKYLPEKDIIHANKFLKLRDFDNLKDLVDSSIIRIKKSRKTNNQKYLDIDLEKLEELYNEIVIYWSYLDVSEFDNSEDNGDEFLDFEEVEYY